MPRMWDVYPLRIALVEALTKKQGVSTDVELYDLLKKSYDDLNYRSLNRVLMKLEVEGMIHVSSLTKTKRRVELKAASKDQERT